MAVAADRAPRAPSATRARFDTFWRWWTGELGQLVPARFGGSSGVSRTPLVAIEADALVLLEPRGAALAELSRVPVGSLDAEGKRLALRNLLAGSATGGNTVRLCLGRDESLLRRVALPLATEENLPQVLAFEMDRLSPFRAEDVYFDHRVASRDNAAGKVNVDLGVARRELVDARVSQLREWGVEVEGVVLADDAARSTSPLDLLPEAPRGGLELSRERTVQFAMAAAVVALLALALVLPIWQKREAVVAMVPLVDKARKDAENTDALARDLEKQVADYNFLLSKKHATQPALAFVEEVSKLLPDNTWVQQLDVRPQGKVREVQIAGETPSSSKLIEIFEQATTMRNAAPRGTVTRGATPGTERFLIAAEARPRALPEALPVTPAPGGSAGAAPGAASPAAAAPSPATVQSGASSQASTSAPVPVSVAPAQAGAQLPASAPATLTVPVPVAPAQAGAQSPASGPQPISPTTGRPVSQVPAPPPVPVQRGGPVPAQQPAPGISPPVANGTAAPQPLTGGSVRPDGSTYSGAPPKAEPKAKP